MYSSMIRAAHSLTREGGVTAQGVSPVPVCLTAQGVVYDLGASYYRILSPIQWPFRLNLIEIYYRDIQTANNFLGPGCVGVGGGGVVGVKAVGGVGVV